MFRRDIEISFDILHQKDIELIGKIAGLYIQQISFMNGIFQPKLPCDIELPGGIVVKNVVIIKSYAQKFDDSGGTIRLITENI